MFEKSLDLKTKLLRDTSAPTRDKTPGQPTGAHTQVFFRRVDRLTVLRPEAYNYGWSVGRCKHTESGERIETIIADY